MRSSNYMVLENVAERNLDKKKCMAKEFFLLRL